MGEVAAILCWAEAYWLCEAIVKRAVNLACPPGSSAAKFIKTATLLIGSICCAYAESDQTVATLPASPSLRAASPNREDNIGGRSNTARHRSVASLDARLEMLSEAYDAGAAANGNSDVVRASAALVAATTVRPAVKINPLRVNISSSSDHRGQLELTEVNSFFCLVKISVSVCGALLTDIKPRRNLAV